MDYDTDIRDEATDLMWDDELTKKEAVAYVLYNRGKPQKEIADIQGVTVPMVAKRLACARRKVDESGGGIVE